MRKPKYLHCVLDEKFIDGAISLFEEDKRIENTYIQFTNQTASGFKYIKSKNVQKQPMDVFLKVVNDYDVVVLHSLPAIPINIIRKIPSRINVVWLMWGYDFYNWQIYHSRWIKPLSERTLTFCERLRKIKAKCFYWLYEGIFFKEALARIDYFSGVFPYEYQLLKELPRYPEIKALPIDFYYGDTNFFIPESPEVRINNKFENVIIGNSADPGNNTLEAFEILRGRLDVNNVKAIIAPLSYGTNKDFINRVKKEGRAIWGNKFFPLDHYLPIGEYLHTVSNCKIAIFFHERQQASDNVLMQLMYGAKVFLSVSSMMYQYLKSLGFYIYSLQEDKDSINTPLTKEQIYTNRTILSHNFSSSKLIERVKVMNNTICNLK